MSRRLTLAACTAALALGAPVVASAAEVVVPECVRSISGAQTLGVTGSGFTPNQTVTLQADGQSLGTAVADAAGAFTQALFPPAFSSANRNQQTFELTAVDAAGVAAAPVPLRVTRVMVDLPDQARPRARVDYKVYGFLTGEPVYLQIRRGGKTRGTYKLGTAQGACGTVSKRMRYMPLARYSTGNYDYHFSHQRKYDRDQVIYSFRIAIFRTFSPS